MGYTQEFLDAHFPIPWDEVDKTRAIEIGKTLETTQSASVAISILNELRALGPAARFAVPSMFVAMGKLSNSVIDRATEILTNPTFMANAAFPSTVLFPDHPNEYFQQFLKATNNASTDDLDVYRLALKDSDLRVRQKALRLIKELGPKAKGLFLELHDNAIKDKFAGDQAVEAIASLESNDLLSVLRKDLSALLDHNPKDQHIRYMLMTTDVYLGNSYTNTLKDPNSDTFSKVWAIKDFRGIERIDQFQASALVEALYDKDREVRNEAAKTIIYHAQNQNRLEVVALALVDRLDVETVTSSAAAYVLQKISKESLPVFLSMLEDVDAGQRLLGVRLIGKLGPTAEGAAAMLQELSNGDVDAEVRDAANRALATVSQGKKNDIILQPPSTTVSNYLVTSEDKAQWMRITLTSTWSAGFTFGSFPATLPTSSLRIVLYDRTKSAIQTNFVSDAFIGQKPGDYFLKIFRKDEGEEVVIPLKVDILEN